MLINQNYESPLQKFKEWKITNIMKNCRLFSFACTLPNIFQSNLEEVYSETLTLRDWLTLATLIPM